LFKVFLLRRQQELALAAQVIIVATAQFEEDDENLDK